MQESTSTLEKLLIKSAVIKFLFSSFDIKVNFLERQACLGNVA